MILDVLENAHGYLALNKGFAKAVEFLLRPDLHELPVERYKIDGDRVYAMVAKEPGRKKEDALLETHEQYIDIQLVLAGTDEMGWKPKLSCQQPSGAYDQEEDIQFFTDEPDAWVPVGPGAFVVFFPEDAHLPLISAGQLHKVVVKVAVVQK
jgi:YhcH/YjgK/YiaL family protein